MTSIELKKPRVERVDDIPVIYGMLERMGIQAIVDGVITPHGNWSGLSPGWVVTLWLVHILSEQNHLMEPVQQWVGRHELILTKLSGQPVRVLDFTDDRLAICLRALSGLDVWYRIEGQLGLRLIRVYDLSSKVLRLDATVGTIHHEPEKSVLFQVGKARNGLYATRFKLMVARLDPLGLPLVVDTAGFACLNPLCQYLGITDDQVHALFGNGKRGIRHDIQHFRCQWCRSDFTCRRNIPLYYLKTAPDRIEMVLWLMAEG